MHKKYQILNNLYLKEYLFYWKLNEKTITILTLVKKVWT